jgi:hypothetical protein
VPLPCNADRVNLRASRKANGGSCGVIFGIESQTIPSRKTNGGSCEMIFDTESKAWQTVPIHKLSRTKIFKRRGAASSLRLRYLQSTGDYKFSFSGSGRNGEEVGREPSGWVPSSREPIVSLSIPLFLLRGSVIRY